MPWGISACAHHLRMAGSELARLPVDVRIAALDRIGRAWRDPDSEHRQDALELLPDELGFSPEMVAWALDAAFAALTRGALERWWAREGGSTSARLSAHIQAGNVFTAGLPPVVASVLAGVPAIIKAPSAFPTFPALFARSVTELAPELGPCVGSAAWSRVDERTTKVLLEEADVAFAFGDDDSIAAIRPLTDTPLHGFGHRVSIGWVGATPDPATVDALACDALAYDGAGCLTPRWILVDGDLDAASAWARLAASRLPAINDRLPALPDDEFYHTDLIGLPVYDTQCGAKWFRVDDTLRWALSRAFMARWAFDVELIGRLLYPGGGCPPWHPSSIVEMPLRQWTDVEGSRVTRRAFLRAGLDLSLIALDLERRRRRLNRASPEAVDTAAGAPT